MKKRTLLLTALTAVLVLMFAGAANAATYSDAWKQGSDGNWHVYRPDGSMVKNAWLCDDAVASNEKNVWYLIDSSGNMITAGLVQDGTGNYYSLETNHNGYYGMLRYKSGTYDGIYLSLESSHNGAFAAILNNDGIQNLKNKYGLKNVSNINNNNCVYTSSFGSSGTTSSGSSNVALNGWINNNGNWYYYQNGNAIQSTWKQIDGKWYYFNGAGKMLTGWQQINGVYYYLEANANGNNGHPYGSMYANETTPDGYYVNGTGAYTEKSGSSSTTVSSGETGGKDYLRKGDEAYMKARYQRTVTDPDEYVEMCYELVEVWCYARNYSLPVRDSALEAKAKANSTNECDPYTVGMKNAKNPYNDMSAVMNTFKVAFYNYFSSGNTRIGIVMNGTTSRIAISDTAGIKFGDCNL